MAQLRVSTVGAYVEAGSGAPQLRVSTVGALLEWRAPPQLRVSTVGAYVEFAPPPPPAPGRPALTEFEARRAYLSIVFHKYPGEADWTLIDQGRAFRPEYAAEIRAYRRIGDPQAYPVAVSRPAANVALELYVDSELEELARLWGARRPSAGWSAGTVIDLDPLAAADYKVENYDGIALTARVVFTEYVNHFWPARLTLALETEDGARVIEVEGFADAYYIVPEATP